MRAHTQPPDKLNAFDTELFRELDAHLAETGGLNTAVTDFAGLVLANSWHTNMETKKLMLATDGMGLAEALAHEQYHYPGFAPDYKDRIANFGKK